MSDESLRDERFITTAGYAGTKVPAATLPGGLNKETVVKLLLAWTVTPFFAGVVAALAYFIISRFAPG